MTNPLACVPLLVAGLDEAGAGPLCGDLFVAAVILDPSRPVAGLNDSKKLSARRREQLAPLIREQALAWSVISVSPEEIDQINIFQSRMRGFERAALALSLLPGKYLIDGNKVPPGLASGAIPAQAIVGGDALEPAISAASILAKVARDESMAAAARQWPGYGFEKHKGYPTALHVQRLSELGPCPIHRKTYGPVATWLAANASGQIRSPSQV
jgi:ribonuclease HII